jgi:hypothetical protein
MALLQTISGATPFVTSDSALVSGDVPPGQSIGVNTTVAGNIKVRLADGSTLTFQVAVSFLVLPWRVTQVFITGTTATATVYNMR